MKDKKGNSKIHIYVVDDDSCILDSVAVYLQKANFECTCFENADDCLEHLQRHHCDLLVTDVEMPEKDGIELLVEAKRIAPWMPVLIMTSYGDIPLAVRSIKAGAVGFIEKPWEWENFLTLVKSIIKQNDLSNKFKGKPLTKTEKIILKLILQDKTNKEIAGILHRSVRTVEVHRSHIMHKLDVYSIVDLVKRATAMGFDEAT
jgi:two-component system response regulator TtrR